MVIHIIQADSFHIFNRIQAFILPQSENISAPNGQRSEEGKNEEAKKQRSEEAKK